ncbi:hypothetical protein HET73_01320 [Wolbachia endosymbiont of Atemnus politus]|uniref:hypothetical protein n=1 Tax=Wolbachia endosymbiont of Atemnus politus TaxID=2682840 RepID=UPI001572AFA2|nr:hypothetical protein [Wolbachia endosymbiont of Atemnus politus]NSM56281.1 hypothetical protein [Wolbachia endosymbiont of Atemnus politus]
MADLRVNITLNLEISKYLVELARIKNQPVQDLAQELMQEAIEIEKEDMALAELATKRSGAERVKLENVKWE